MDKYEFNIKVEQLKKLFNSGDYETAMKIADSIDWRRVSSVSLLSIVSEIYEKNQDFAEAKEVLLIAFENAPFGKRLLYKLTLLALKQGEIAEAEAYYKEFCNVAQDDSRECLLRYMILKEKKAPIGQLIHALESYNRTELDEKWMYELAELYHESGDSDKCIKICDNIMLMFGIGKYVDKAITLKTEKEGADLTDYQQSLIDNRAMYAEKLREVEAEYAVEDEEVLSDFNTEVESMDEEITAHIKELDAQMLSNEAENITDGAIYIEEDNEVEMEDSIDQTIEDVLERDSNEGTVEDIIDDTTEDVEEINESVMQEKEPRYNILIEAKTPKEGLEIAKECLRSIHNITGSDNKVTKIKADKLNDKGVLACSNVISGKDLIIEEAGDLSTESFEELVEFIKTATNQSSVLLIDNPMQISKIINEQSIINQFFEHLTLDAAMMMLEDKTIKDNLNNDNNVGIINDRNSKIAKEELGGDETSLRNADEYDNDEAMLQETIDFSKAQKFINRDQNQSNNSVAESFEDREFTKEDSELAKEEYDSEDVHSKEMVSNEKLEEMSIDEFAHYASEYAKAIDCSIKGKSMLALYERIEIMEEDNIALTPENAEALIEEAADQAEKPPFLVRIKNLFSSKYDKEGMLILKEEHFIS